jgi:hypothetical protein
MAFMTRLVFLTPAQRERDRHGMLEAVWRPCAQLVLLQGREVDDAQFIQAREAQADVEFSSLIIQT